LGEVDDTSILKTARLAPLSSIYPCGQCSRPTAQRAIAQRFSALTQSGHRSARIPALQYFCRAVDVSRLAACPDSEQYRLCVPLYPPEVPMAQALLRNTLFWRQAK
jgi:hypothetical protein